MQPRQNLLRWLVALTGVVALTAAAMATADPPSRVARLAYFEGNVSFSPAGDDQWVAAVVNRPLIVGDRLWSDTGSRAELQMTNVSLRFGPLTSVTILNLDDRTQQLQLTQGVLHLQVRRLAANEIIEIDTPNFAFSVTRPGSYRFEVDPRSGGTLIAVRAGEGEAYGDGATYRIAAGQAFRFYGTDLRDQEYLALPAIDGFERWSLARAGRYERVVTARYVAPEVIGYEDLDDYGTWRVVANYGNVWSPRSVPSGWAPYRNGHWAWIDPWGWTWIDDAPWGFAPYHYGRWAQLEDDRWCWVPGPVRSRPVYAPALVAFVGGAGFSISATSGASIGWFPLAPGEVYRPAYSTSRDYFTRINVTNTVVNNTYVTNIYNNRDTATNIRYANMQRPAAITAVPQAAFVQGQPVQRATLSVTPQVMNRAQVLPLATIAPQPASIRGAAPEARARPPAALLEMPVVAKALPPPAPVMPGALNAAPGRAMERPSDNAGRRVPVAPGAPAPTASAPPPNVRVVQSVPAKPAPTVTTANAPGRPERPGQGDANAPRSAAPGAPPLTGVPPGATARPEQAPEPRGQRGRSDMTPAPQPPAAAAPAAPDARPFGRPMAAPERPATVAPPPAAVAPSQPPAVAAPPQPTDEGRLRGNERRGREAQPAPSQPPPAPMPRPEARPLPPQPAAPPAAVAPPQPPAVAPPQPADEGRLRGNERRGREAQPAPPQPPPAPMPRPEARPPQPQPSPPPQAAPPPRPVPQAAPAPPPEARPAPAAGTPPAPPPQVQQGKGKGEEKRDKKRDEKDNEQK